MASCATRVLLHIFMLRGDQGDSWYTTENSELCVPFVGLQAQHLTPQKLIIAQNAEDGFSVPHSAFKLQPLGFLPPPPHFLEISSLLFTSSLFILGDILCV